MLYTALQKLLAREEHRKVNPDTDTEPSLGHEYNYNIAKPYIRNKKLLDVGCWSGQFEKLAIRETKDIVGLDYSKEAILFAKKSLKGPKYIVGTATKLPFKNATFDVVTFFDVLEHIPIHTELICLKEVQRVLKPKGLILFCTPYKHPISIILDPSFWSQGHRHYGKEELKSLFSNAGFQIVELSIEGGLWNASLYIVSMAFKHVLKIKLQIPVAIKKKIQDESKPGGIMGIRIIAQKR